MGVGTAIYGCRILILNLSSIYMFIYSVEIFMSNLAINISGKIARTWLELFSGAGIIF